MHVKHKKTLRRNKRLELTHHRDLRITLQVVNVMLALQHHTIG